VGSLKTLNITFIKIYFMNTNESYAVFAIASTLITSFIYFLILDKMKAAKREKTRARIISLYTWRKISGFLLLGALPAITALVFFKADLFQAGVSLGSTGHLWPWIAGASVLFISLNFLNNSKDQNLRAVYPELRLSEWDPGRLSILAGGWVLYFIGYEFLFRGLLLFSCYNAFGYWPAIVINLALYSALHLPKGLKEATVAIPFGLLLCYLTIESHSILPAIIIHSAQAISFDLCCIYRNQEMNINLFKMKKP
jgi:membrane protease YdiL (CAAX protease family)